MPHRMIQLRHISKRFGPVAALEDVSLDIAAGSVLGLLGENGAGKSTLMNILFGLVKPGSGGILVEGREVRIRSPRAATALGIGMVHQHFKLVPTLNAVENLTLFLPGSQSRWRIAAVEWLARLKWSLPLDVRVERLAVGMQQRVEILKALLAVHERSHGTMPALILDEPTAVLTPQESLELFSALAALRQSGTAIVLISHKLEEVRKVCDQVAILRRGRLVHAGGMAALSGEQIAEKMIGTHVEMPRPRTPVNAACENKRLAVEVPLSQPLLSLQNISTDQLLAVSLDLRPGEILGIAGVDGNGQAPMVQVLLGILRARSGSMTLLGADASHQSTRARLGSIAFIAEDRQREALVLPLSIRDNLMLKDYRERRFNTLGWLRFRAWGSQARELMQEFDIRAGSPADTTAQLSGGNQQKVVIARELHASSKPVVLAVNPTRGLDVGATAFVLRQLLAARERGAGVLLIHPDLDELLAVSDRVAVLYNGTLTQTPWPATTKEVIGRLMLGMPGTEVAA